MQTNHDNLIAKYLSGNASLEERETLMQWVNESAANAAIFERSRQVWDASASLKSVEEYDVDSAWNQFSAIRESEPKVIRLTRKRQLQIAAAFFLMVSTAFLLRFFFSGAGQPVNFTENVHPRVDTFVPTATLVPEQYTLESESPKSIDKKRTARQPVMIAVSSEDTAMIFTLPDNSKVYLNRNSKLIYPENFAKGDRTVYLSGEAFFEVSKNKGEFFVYCQDTKTRVMGTAFNVKGFQPSNKVEVTVISGVVEVSSTNLKAASTLVLKEGDKSTFDPVLTTFTKQQASKKDRWWKRSNFRSRVKNFFNRITHRKNKSK
jgi:transmembrane sensor